MRHIFQVSVVAVCLLTFSLPALAESGSTTLHPGDKVSITVYNHPDLASEPVLDGMGRISMPLIGTIDAQTLNVDQLAQKITDELKRYVISPAVDVQLVSAGTSIFLVGPIAGVLSYAPGETLMSALSQAQSLQSAAFTNTGSSLSGQAPTSSPTMSLRTLHESGVDLRHVTLRRDGADQGPINVEDLMTSGQSGPTLLPGDTIALRDRPIAVKVSGVVAHPLVAYLYEDEPLRNALRQAGGIDDTTARITFTLIRNGKHLDLTSLSPEISRPAVPGDEINVPQAPRVMVAGQVLKPGQLAVQGDPSLLSAIYLAGGPQTNGDLRHIMVYHDGKQVMYDLTKIKNGVPQNNPLLADGDSIFVPTVHHADFSQIFESLIVLNAFRR